MHIIVTSGGIGAVCAVLTLIGGVGLWCVRAIVGAEIRKLNGRYIYSAGSKLNGHEIEGRLDALESKASA